MIESAPAKEFPKTVSEITPRSPIRNLGKIINGIEVSEVKLRIQMGSIFSLKKLKAVI